MQENANLQLQETESIQHAKVTSNEENGGKTLFVCKQKHLEQSTLTSGVTGAKYFRATHEKVKI